MLATMSSMIKETSVAKLHVLQVPITILHGNYVDHCMNTLANFHHTSGNHVITS